MPITDPYKVLGVPTTATDDEVKQAYRRLAKKYHPDANPGDKVAEQRMKEINAAYDQIINGSASSGGYGGNSSGSSYSGNSGYAGDYGGSYGGHRSAWEGSGYAGQSADPRMNAARNYISFGHYQEALNVLSSIRERDGLWYYYSAIANNGAGNKIVAIQHAQKAVELEPGNAVYSELLDDLQNPGRQYAGYGRDFSAPFLSLNRLCGGFIISWLMCMYCNYCCR